VSEIEPPQLQLRIVSSVPLLRLGLERVAVEAGFSLVSDDRAQIVLHGAEDAQSNADVDIVGGTASVTLTVRGAPDPPTWAALRDLLDGLLDTADRRRRTRNTSGTRVEKNGTGGQLGD